jgi:lipopolysaccharide/colanic/teichoic acid biosynthesis glycosyltransferase
MSDDIELASPIAIRSLRSISWIGVQFALKRAFDFVGSLTLILFLGPVMLGAAAAVRLSSTGPVFFRQKRWGRGGVQFNCWKFRTMHVRQDQFLDPAILRRLQDQGVLLKLRKDPRVTRVGAFLRKTSIDELPQLLNVVTGDMSLVGPRPLMLHMLAPYPELCEARGQMRPGITGLWQISAREQNETAQQMAQYDLAYIRDFSLWNDLKILARTPAVVLFHTGAY